MFEPRLPAPAQGVSAFELLSDPPNVAADPMWLRRQRTIGQSLHTRGIGFFTGCDVSMSVLPAAPGHGVTFERADRPERAAIPATIDHLAALPRRTALAWEDGEPAVQMIEHTMAAIAGLSLDNLRIVLDGPECPGFDGSSEESTGRLLDAGVIEQEAARPVLEIVRPVEVRRGEAFIRAEPSSRPTLEIDYTLDYAHPLVGRQTYHLELSPRVFAFQLADARTFILEEEVAGLRAMGIGLRHTERDLLVFGDDGPIGNRLRHSDEPVRHKVLDCIGDFALTGCELRGRFTCHGSGHALNHALVREVLATHAVVQSSQPVLRAA